MTNKDFDRPSPSSPDGLERREWIKPTIDNMLAGAAELAGDTSIDGGDPGLS